LASVGVPLPDGSAVAVAFTSGITVTKGARRETEQLPGCIKFVRSNQALPWVGLASSAFCAFPLAGAFLPFTSASSSTGTALVK